MEEKEEEDFEEEFDEEELDLTKDAFFADLMDMEEEFKEIHKKCKKCTMTSVQRMYSLYIATKHIVQHKIPVPSGRWTYGKKIGRSHR